MPPLRQPLSSFSTRIVAAFGLWFAHPAATAFAASPPPLLNGGIGGTDSR